MRHWPSNDPWPTIGFDVADFIEGELVHGPGPVAGAAPKLTNEELRFILRAYEVHPYAQCGEPGCDCLARVGQFRTVWNDYVRLKGARKSELAAWLAHVELCGPSRFYDWGPNDKPLAASVALIGGVADIPFAATSEDQAEDTAWSSFYAIARACSYASSLDITQRKVVDQRTGGNARVVTSSSIARDGGRPTATVVEEPHLWFSRELKDLYKTLDRNLAKLGSNDPHGFKVSTMFRVGQHSVLEDDYEAVRNGDRSILWDHRGAEGKLDPANDDDVIAGVKQAIGDAVWLDPNRIANNFKRDRREGVRYWWNKRSTDVSRLLDPEEWVAIAEPRDVEDGEPIVLGFDGSLFDDATALSARSLLDGYSWPLGVWLPSGTDDGPEEIRSAVEGALADAAGRWRLVLMLCDPPYWGESIAHWRGTYGERVVVPWWTNRDSAMSWATHRWLTGVTTKAWRHDGDPTVRLHVENAHRKSVRVSIDGRPAFVPSKERHHSPNKIDACVTDILSHEARYIAIQQGALEKHNRKRDRTLYTF